MVRKETKTVVQVEPQQEHFQQPVAKFLTFTSVVKPDGTVVELQVLPVVVMVVAVLTFAHLATHLTID